MKILVSYRHLPKILQILRDITKKKNKCRSSRYQVRSQCSTPSITTKISSIVSLHKDFQMYCCVPIQKKHLLGPMIESADLY